MAKKFLPGLLLLVAICCIGISSCKKSTNSTADLTRNYFPITFGKYITYAVDSVYYDASTCTKYEIKSQLKYAVTDTFRDQNRNLCYLLDVFSRPYDGSIWQALRVITIRPTTSSLFYTQDNAEYIKMIFPIVQGATWKGNANINVTDPEFAYLAGWNYTYQNYHMSYNNGIVNFDNTVTVLEDNESINYPNVDSAVAASRTYAKEIYAYNVGMIYKEWTHTTYQPSSPQCLNGYTVIMQAIDYN